MAHPVCIYIFILNISFTTHCLYVSTNYENCQIPTIHVNFAPLLAQHLFYEMYVKISDAMQFIESFCNRFSARIFLEKICHWISLLHFDNFKHLRAPIWRVTFIKSYLEFAHAYRITYFVASRGCGNLYVIVYHG